MKHRVHGGRNLEEKLSRKKPIVVAIIVIIAIAGIGGYFVLKGGEEGVSTVKWHSMANFSGTSRETTAPFNILGDKFRVHWSYTAESEDLGWLFFNVGVYPTESIHYKLMTFGFSVGETYDLYMRIKATFERIIDTEGQTSEGLRSFSADLEELGFDAETAENFWYTCVSSVGEEVGNVKREDYPISDSGTIYIYEGGRSYYLYISVLYLRNWTINVEDFY